MTNTLSVERRAALKRQAQAIGYDLDYQPEVMMEDIRLLPESFWHENRVKANGVYKGRVLKGINRNEFLSLYNKWQSKEITKEYTRKKLNVSLSTLDRRIAQYRKTGN